MAAPDLPSGAVPGSTLGSYLSEDQAGLASTRAVDPAAYEAYMKGVGHSVRSDPRFRALIKRLHLPE